MRLHDMTIRASPAKRVDLFARLQSLDPTPLDFSAGPSSAAFVIGEADVPEFRIALAEIARTGYSEAAVCHRFGLDDITGLRWKLLQVYRAERLTQLDPLALAIELFLLQGAVAADALARLFSQ